MKSNAHLLNIQSDTSTTFESAIQQIKDMGYSKVLVEGGRNFLNSLIDEDLLDIFFLTKTESSPHENVMPLSRLFSDLARNGLIQFSAQKSGTDTFYIYVRSSFTHLTTQ